MKQLLFPPQTGYFIPFSRGSAHAVVSPSWPTHGHTRTPEASRIFSLMPPFSLLQVHSIPFSPNPKSTLRTAWCSAGRTDQLAPRPYSWLLRAKCHAPASNFPECCPRDHPNHQQGFAGCHRSGSGNVLVRLPRAERRKHIGNLSKRGFGLTANSIGRASGLVLAPILSFRISTSTVESSD